MITLDRPNSNIVRFCKHHKLADFPQIEYSYSDFGKNLASLKILCGEWLGNLPEHVGEESILAVLTQVIERVGKKEELYRQLPRIVFQPYGSYRESAFERFVEVAMGILSILQVKEVLPLGKFETLIEFT